MKTVKDFLRNNEKLISALCGDIIGIKDPGGMILIYNEDHTRCREITEDEELRLVEIITRVTKFAAHMKSELNLKY